MRESLSYQNKDDCTFTPQIASPKNMKAAAKYKSRNYDYE